MLRSTQQIRKVDLDYYVINRQWFSAVYIILCNLQNKFADLAYKDTRQTSHWLLTKRKRKKNFFLQAFTRNFSWISFSCVIYSPNWLGLTWNLKLTIFQIKLAFHQQNKKIIKRHTLLLWHILVFTIVLHRMTCWPRPFSIYGITKCRYQKT